MFAQQIKTSADFWEFWSGKKHNHWALTLFTDSILLSQNLGAKSYMLQCTNLQAMPCQFCKELRTLFHKEIMKIWGNQPQTLQVKIPFIASCFTPAALLQASRETLITIPGVHCIPFYILIPESKECTMSSLAHISFIIHTYKLLSTSTLQRQTLDVFLLFVWPLAPGTMM